MNLPPEITRLRRATSDYLGIVDAAEVALRETVSSDREEADWLHTLRDHLGEMRENSGGTPEGCRWLLEETDKRFPVT
jgi:hypothetical protein